VTDGVLEEVKEWRQRHPHVHENHQPITSGDELKHLKGLRVLALERRGMTDRERQAGAPATQV